MAHVRAVRATPAELIAASENPLSPDTILFATLLCARGDLRLLGLSREQATWLRDRHFSGMTLPAANPWALLVLTAKQAEFVKALSTFLLDHVDRSVNVTDAQCLATIIAHACLRPDHLWRDLGLGGRDEVTAMLERYFPALVTRNIDGTRWKKFLARELALSMGQAPQPAPGCPGCVDFGICFGAGE